MPVLKSGELEPAEKLSADRRLSYRGVEEQKPQKWEYEPSFQMHVGTKHTKNSLLINKTSITRVLHNTSRDLSQNQRTLPPLQTVSSAFHFLHQADRREPKTPGLTPRGKIRAHLGEEFLNFSLLSD